MSSKGDPVIRRTMFYERNFKDNIEQYRFLPFYLVTVQGAESGKMFEPVGCSPRTFPGDVIKEEKTIHRIEEFDGKPKLFQCEIPGTQLHSFGSWDFPRN